MSMIYVAKNIYLHVNCLLNYAKTFENSKDAKNKCMFQYGHKNCYMV